MVSRATRSIDADLVRKSFVVCGIRPNGAKVDAHELHRRLQSLIESSLDVVDEEDVSTECPLRLRTSAYSMLVEYSVQVTEVAPDEQAATTSSAAMEEEEMDVGDDDDEGAHDEEGMDDDWVGDMDDIELDFAE